MSSPSSLLRPAFAVLSSAFIVLSFILSCTFVVLSSSGHDRITTKVTWEGDIARIVRARCVKCHAPDGPGPMSLMTWEEARPWAKAIKEEVLTRRMPKWHAVRGYGDLSNDPSLSPFEITLIVSWADGGAPKGESGPGERLRPERPFDVAQGRPELVEGRGANAPSESAPGEPSAASSADARDASRGGGAPRQTEMRPTSAEKGSRDGAMHPDGAPALTRTLACGSQPLTGRLLAIRPQLPEGGSAQINVDFPDGRRDIVAWIRDFDPDFAETYWLRTPPDLPRRSRLTTAADGPCSIVVTIGSR